MWILFNFTCYLLYQTIFSSSCSLPEIKEVMEETLAHLTDAGMSASGQWECGMVTVA